MKLLDKIRCKIKHDIKRSTFSVWCCRCGTGKTWNGVFWKESMYPHCKKCGQPTNIKDAQYSFELCDCGKEKQDD